MTRVVDDMTSKDKASYMTSIKDRKTTLISVKKEACSSSSWLTRAILKDRRKSLLWLISLSSPIKEQKRERQKDSLFLLRQASGIPIPIQQGSLVGWINSSSYQFRRITPRKLLVGVISPDPSFLAVEVLLSDPDLSPLNQRPCDVNSPYSKQGSHLLRYLCLHFSIISFAPCSAPQQLSLSPEHQTKHSYGRSLILTCLNSNKKI